MHPLVNQLHFTRTQWRLAFAGLTEPDATRRLMPANSLGWMIGHLAFNEHIVWGVMGRGLPIAEDVSRFMGGRLASTPAFAEVWAIWERVIDESDAFLTQLTQEDMERRLQWEGVPERDTIGTMLLNNIYHYWYHLGESQMVRQLMGHDGLTEYVSPIVGRFAYRPE